MVNELLTTCHPHSPNDIEPPKITPEPPKQNASYSMPLIIQEQKLYNEEVRYNELGDYCKIS